MNIRQKKIVNSQQTINFQMKYKTEKCKLWYEKGYCPYRQFCAFAHDKDEIRSKKELNYNYKTKLCINYSNNGYCKYGNRCQYLHLLKKTFEDTKTTRSNSTESNLSLKNSFQYEPNKIQKKRILNNSQKKQILGQFGIDVLNLFFGVVNSRIVNKMDMTSARILQYENNFTDKNVRISL